MGTTRDLVEQWWSLFEAGRLQDAAQLAQPDVDVIQPGAPRIHGREELIAMLSAFSEGFSGIRHRIVDAVETGDKIAVELTVSMIHTGTFRTPQGDIPSTGKTIVVESVDFVTVRDGKIGSWHTYFDGMAFAAQLGLLPEPAAA